MRFSTKTRYGIRTMVEIAQSDQDKGIFQKDISQNQDISNKYLDQIILALKVSELIRNIKGHKSGYVLNRQPSEITLFDIHCAFEAGICVIDCMYPKYECNRQDVCKVKGFWSDLNTKIIDHFKSVTLADLMGEVTLE